MKKQIAIKNKIAWKLTLYFSTALLLFSVIIGAVFMVLFRNHAIELNKTTLSAKAVSMAETLSSMASSGSDSGSMPGKQGGYGAYLRFLGDIAMTDVWIVDEDLTLLASGPSGSQYNYSALPADAKDIVSQVFAGNTPTSEGFSTVLHTPMLTVGAPILADGKVVGALLLHSPVSGLKEGILQGYEYLSISIAVALLLSVLLSVFLALTFSKPLKKMKNTAVRLTQGDYTAKTDVSQQDEIGQLASAIDVLSDRLDLASHESERLQKLRRDFMASVSHELRTPVTVIRGSLEALRDEVVTDSAQVKEYYRNMLTESISLQRLVDDLLDLSRLQNTDFAINMGEVNLCDIMKDVARSAQQMAVPKNIEIRTEADSPVCSIMGDYGRLRQMLMVILDNAVKFSSENSIVTLSLIGKTLRIRDNGIGIPPEELPYIFDRFYKGKSDRNRNGTGLGLAIAKQIADRHSIRISVESAPGAGSVFEFSF